MATNADEIVADATTVADDDKPVTEDDLRDLKYGEEGVENSQETDEPAEPAKEEESTKETDSKEDGQTDDQTTETEEQSEESFVKQFPHIKGETPEEYAKNLEKAYENSTAEFQRLRSEATKETSADETTTEPTAPADPNLLYAQRLVNKDIQKTYDTFQKDYPQLQDPIEYDKFVSKTRQLSSFIYASENRAATADELYPQVATILGWQKEAVITGDDKLKMALKDSASTSKSSSATKKTSQSKVTDAMIAGHRRMYPDDTRNDAAVREELEPYVT